MTFTTVESRRYVARHVVSVVEALSGRRIEEIEGHLVPTPDATDWCDDPQPHPVPSGWWLHAKNGEIRVASSDRFDAPGPLTLGVSITSERRRQLLSVGCLTLDLTAEVLDLAFPPAPMKVYVTAVLPDGSPSTGKTLELEGSDSTRVPLAETGSPGVYESPHDHSFTSAFRTFDLFIGTEPIRSASLNLDQLTTRVRIVDST